MLPRSLSAACQRVCSKPRLAPFFAVFFSLFLPRAIRGFVSVRIKGCWAMIFYCWLLVKKCEGRLNVERLRRGRMQVKGGDVRVILEGSLAARRKRILPHAGPSGENWKLETRRQKAEREDSEGSLAARRKRILP